MDDPSLMPDLSHLSAEEREIIEQVFKRQRDEEAKETQMSQKATEELGELDKQINERKETSRKLIGTQDDAICQICQKTKFADGIGHKCFYCQLRSCARCGGRSQSKNKAIWACSLCQKRQQILAKTGKWFQPEPEIQPKASVSGPPQQQPQTLESEPQQQARPAEPPDKINSLPPQQQQQHQPQQQPAQRQTQMNQQNPNLANHQGANNRQQQPMPQNQNQNHNMNRNTMPTQSQNQPVRNSNPNQQQQQQNIHNQRPNEMSRNMQNSHRSQGPSNHHNNQDSYQQLPQQNSNQSLIENSRNDGRDDSNTYNKKHSVERMSSQNRYSPGKTEHDVSNHRPTFHSGNTENHIVYNEGTNQQQSLRKNTGTRVTEEDYASSANFETKKQRNNSTSNAESHSQNVRACPPNDDHMNRVKNRLHRQLRSMSSSEEDMMSGGGGSALKISTSAVVAAGGKTFHEDMGASNVQRLSEECNSEKDLLRYIYGDCKNPDQANNINSMKNIQQQRRKDKSISISPCRNKNADNFGSGIISGGDLLASRIRTFLSHPVTWQPSADQKRLIGHMILHRTENSASNGDLGLKIVGGRRTDTGKLGAFITQVKPGSVADTVGRLRPGDEVVEWNGQSLQNATYEQVYDSIAASRYDIQVELIVSRSAILPGGDDFLNISSHAQSSQHLKASGMPQYSRQLPNPEMFAGRDPFPSVPLTQQQQQILSHSQSAVFAPNNAFSARNRSTSSYYYPDIPDLGVPPHYREMQPQQAFGTGHIFGRIEVSFVYSHHDRQLSVALERSYDLPPRPDGTPRNPYVKIFLLPDRSEKSRRQSAVIAETLMPVWNEVFYYNDLTEPMILQRVLEMTVWDYDKFGTNSFLGETLIDLASVPLDGEHSLICTLVDMDDDNPLRTRLKLRKSSYHQPLRRPQSELNYYDHSSYYNHVGGSGVEREDENDEYIDDDELENDIDLATGSVLRKSRPYDRHRRDKSHGYADWSMNHQRHSGAFNRRQHNRRPRSATALMHTGREDMYDQRKFSKNSDKHDEDDFSQNGRHGSQYYLGDSTLYEDSRYKIPQTQIVPPSSLQPHQPPHPQMQSQQQSQPNQPMLPAQGYYSDGSETMSVNSCNSMPMITTINRRNLVNNPSTTTTENTSFEENNRVSIKETKQSSMANSSSMANNSTSANNTNTAATMKERKKSLMTRFIPGRGVGNEGKRTGFARSEEVGIPGNYSSDRLVEPTPPFLKQASKESTDSAHSDNWLPILADGPLGTFVDNLGPGQVVGRQVLASPVLGEIQIGLMAGRSGIDVEIIRAKNLVAKPGVKICPAPYVKVYLMEGKQCVAKAKTNAASKTTNPLFQQHLIFNDTPKKKMLQITVLGDYGRMERKVFMGISQIRLEDLELGSQPLIGWYKLFHSSSLAGTGPVRKDSDVSVGGAQQ